MSVYQFEIGTSLMSMTNVELLGTKMPAPKSKFIPYVKYVTLANGTVRGVGYPTAEWRWGFLRWDISTETYRDALRDLLPTPSTLVYIKTIINEVHDSYQTFSAIAVWPLEENKDTHRRLDFAIVFKHMQLVTEG